MNLSIQQNQTRSTVGVIQLCSKNNVEENFAVNKRLVNQIQHKFNLD
jgi:hypothetical protein